MGTQSGTLTSLADKTHYPQYPRSVYKESELVAARAHELMAGMGLALEIIIKNSPARRQLQPSSRSSSGVPLDDATFACEFGLEQYREGFQRRSMQSEPSPVKVIVQGAADHSDDSSDTETLQQQQASTEHKAAEQSVVPEKPKATNPVPGRRAASLSIQDIVKGLRDDMSDGNEDDYATAVEERTDPLKDALAVFLNWRAPPRSTPSSSVYSQ